MRTLAKYLIAVNIAAIIWSAFMLAIGHRPGLDQFTLILAAFGAMCMGAALRRGANDDHG
jgi:hypothetical protein